MKLDYTTAVMTNQLSSSCIALILDLATFPLVSIAHWRDVFLRGAPSDGRNGIARQPLD